MARDVCIDICTRAFNHRTDFPLRGSSPAVSPLYAELGRAREMILLSMMCVDWRWTNRVMFYQQSLDGQAQNTLWDDV
jgi:hypothetical protein